MFELNEVDVRCKKVTNTSNNMGNSENTEVGLSLKLEFNGDCKLLDKFGSRIRKMFYQSAAGGQQEDLTDFTPELIVENLGPIPLKDEFPGCSATIHSDLEFIPDMEIEDVKVDGFVVDLKKGGTVEFVFRIYFKPDLELAGKFLALEKHNFTLSVRPPKVSAEGAVQVAKADPAQPDLIDDKPKDALYDKAVAIVRNGTEPSAMHIELKISAVKAAEYLMRMEEEGVIAKNGEEYVVVAEA